MKQLTTYRLVFKVFLFFLFLGYQAGTKLYYHAHLQNGQIIVHSHPYKKAQSSSTSFPSHSHTREEFNYFQVIKNSCLDDRVFVCDAPIFFTGFMLLSSGKLATSKFEGEPDLNLLRGPPDNCQL